MTGAGPPGAADLRAAFGAYPTGVTVVTARGADGAPYGFTANSFSSVSLDPPLLSVCPGRFLSGFAVMQGCTHFAVSVLAEGQEEIATLFARSSADRFAACDWTGDTQDCPLIDGAAAQFSCSTHAAIDAGDHLLLLGRILQVAHGGGRGLGYAQGGFFSLGLERQAATGPAGGQAALAGVIVEADGAVLLQDTPAGLRPPHIALTDRGGLRPALETHFAQAGLPLVLGHAFSVYDDRVDGTHHSYFHAVAQIRPGPEHGRLVPVADLPAQRFASAALAQMMARYAREYVTRDFALYVGDDRAGDVHAISTGR